MAINVFTILLILMCALIAQSNEIDSQCKNSSDSSTIFYNNATSKLIMSFEDLTFREQSQCQPQLREQKLLTPSIPTLSTGPHTRILSNNHSVSSTSSSVSQNTVSETDLYLLAAIEKLVYRMDLMDQRLRRAEDIIQHLGGDNDHTTTNDIKRQDACPGNFTKAGKICYEFSERQYNWKAASSMCKSAGGYLLEFDQKEQYVDLVTYILSEPKIRGHDYWTGGLNPGLLWIWSNSGRPVGADQSLSSTNNGRCLKLAFNGSPGKGNLYSLSGVECSYRFRYICQHQQTTTDRALNRLHKSLQES